MIAVDTSAIVAVLRYEPDAKRFSQVLADVPWAVMSAVTRVELSLVIEGRNREAGRADLENFLRQSQIEIIPVSLQQTEIAIEAFRQYGKGRHRAALNIGDCFSYALAKATDLPLLFKGDDFAHTDIHAALTT